MDPIEADRPLRITWRSLGLYALLIGAGIGGFYLIRHLGRDLAATPPPAGEAVFGEGDAKLKVDALMHVLLALAVVIVAARALGALFASCNQPPVIGEVVAGILLGPVAARPGLARRRRRSCCPPASRPFLSVIAQVGVILYMFLVGLELDAGLLRQRAHADGRHLARQHRRAVPARRARSRCWLYPRLSPAGRALHQLRAVPGRGDVGHGFPGAGAHPDRPRHAQDARSASIALTCAAVDDVTAWCLLAFVVGVAQARAGERPADRRA